MPKKFDDKVFLCDEHTKKEFNCKKCDIFYYGCTERDSCGCERCCISIIQKKIMPICFGIHVPSMDVFHAFNIMSKTKDLISGIDYLCNLLCIETNIITTGEANSALRRANAFEEQFNFNRRFFAW